MNKSALVIQLLHALRAHNEFVSLSTLAKELETTVRNIREYKKELDYAGYQIETKRGINGGYYLNQSSLIPAVKLTSGEEKAMDSAVKLLAQRPEYLYYNDFVQACGKFLNNNSKSEPIRTVFQQSASVKMNEAIRLMVDLLQDAATRCIAVELQYASLHRKGFRSIQIQPYDVVNVNGAYYVVGYALEHHAFRSYKITEERMRRVSLLDRTFVRDRTYLLSHYIGNKSIAKTSKQTVSLQIFGDLAIYVHESEVGLESTSHFEDNVLHLTTTFENEKACDSFILSLGSDAKVVGPPDVKDRIRKKVEQMLQSLKE